MKNKLKKIAVILVGAAAVILLSSTIGHAQNFSDMIAPEAITASPPMEGVSIDPAIVAPPILEDDLNIQIPDIELPLSDASKYTLGVNDVISIDVLRHPEVSGQYIINNEGKIQYGFAGDVVVVGKTKDEVKEKVAELLTKYIIDPDVTIQIVGYNSKAVYVIGEVGRPGKIFMRGDTITVREALVQAGLPTLGASTKKCRLITPADEGKAEIQYVNIFTLLYEGDLRENLVMKPGDTLYIPATILTKAMRVISPITAPVGAVAGAGSTVMTGF